MRGGVRRWRRQFHSRPLLGSGEGHGGGALEVRRLGDPTLPQPAANPPHGLRWRWRSLPMAARTRSATHPSSTVGTQAAAPSPLPQPQVVARPPVMVRPSGGSGFLICCPRRCGSQNQVEVTPASFSFVMTGAAHLKQPAVVAQLKNQYICEYYIWSSTEEATRQSRVELGPNGARKKLLYLYGTPT